MPKPTPLVLTAKGNPITRNPARVVFAADCLRRLTYSAARDEIVKHWGIHPATAEKDIRAARQLIALELDAIEVRAGEVRRNERIADKAEELAVAAAKRAELASSSAADWGAVAALQRTAIPCPGCCSGRPRAAAELGRGQLRPRDTAAEEDGNCDERRIPEQTLHGYLRARLPNDSTLRALDPPLPIR